MRRPVRNYRKFKRKFSKKADKTKAINRENVNFRGGIRL